jgi:dTDP-4-dehydrorhamnose 3,5-epimerase
MRFRETDLTGVWLVELELRRDVRGFFARTFCSKELNAHGVEFAVVQANIALTYQRGTVRGLHYQVAPAAEAKFVRCTRGAVYDVAVDVRPGSATERKYIAVELTAENRRTLFVPPGFAHGYQTLQDETEVSYLVNECYTPDCERGLRYNDPALGIEWPLPPVDLSPKDLAWPLLP